MRSNSYLHIDACIDVAQLIKLLIYADIILIRLISLSRFQLCDRAQSCFCAGLFVVTIGFLCDNLVSTCDFILSSAIYARIWFFVAYAIIERICSTLSRTLNFPDVKRGVQTRRAQCNGRRIPTLACPRCIFSPRVMDPVWPCICAFEVLVLLKSKLHFKVPPPSPLPLWSIMSSVQRKLNSRRPLGSWIFR